MGMAALEYAEKMLRTSEQNASRAHAGFEERRGTDAAGNPITWVWCRQCGTNHQRSEHCPARIASNQDSRTK
jgi:rubrerythrin